GTDDAVQAHQPQIRVDAYFGEYRREAEDRLRPVRLFDRIVVPVADERGQPVARQQLDIGDIQILSRQHQRTVDNDHVVANRTGEGRISPGERQLDRPVARGF